MSGRKLRRLRGILLLVLMAGSLSACGCGPLGFNYCGGYGGGAGWHGGGPGGPGGGHGGHGGHGGGPGGGRGGWR